VRGGPRYDEEGNLLTGRNHGPTGKELKKSFTIRAYPSDVESLQKIDKTLQKAVDSGVHLLLGKRNAWTTEKPTSPGWFWVRRAGFPWPMWIQEVTDTDTTTDGYEWCEVERPL